MGLIELFKKRPAENEALTGGGVVILNSPVCTRCLLLRVRFKVFLKACLIRKLANDCGRKHLVVDGV